MFLAYNNLHVTLIARLCLNYGQLHFSHFLWGSCLLLPKRRKNTTKTNKSLGYSMQHSYSLGKHFNMECTKHVNYFNKPMSSHACLLPTSKQTIIKWYIKIIMWTEIRAWKKWLMVMPIIPRNGYYLLYKNNSCDQFMVNKQ